MDLSLTYAWERLVVLALTFHKERLVLAQGQAGNNCLDALGSSLGPRRQAILSDFV
jgi:hypothetical protein